MRRIGGWTLILATVALPLQAQAVLLRLNPRDGMVIRNQLTMETHGPRGFPSQVTSDTTLPLFRATLWQTQTITDLTEEEFTLTQVLDSVQIESPSLPMLAGLASETNDMMRGMVTVTRMTRRGVTTHVDVQLPEAMQDNVLAEALRGGLAGVDGGIGSQMNVALPERPVQVGETWLDSLDLTVPASGLDSSGTASYHTASTLRSLDGPVAVIGIVGNLRLAGSGLTGPLPSSTVTIEGEIRVDLEAGHLVSMTSEMSTRTPGPSGDLSFKVLVSSITR